MKYFALSVNRETKARKIEAVLSDFLSAKSIRGKRMLDLGCGSGHIAEYFSQGNDVIAADIVDQTTVIGKRTFDFMKLDRGLLPFEDASFDIVIFNHVIFCSADQVGLMKEIKRVMKNDGVCYFATTNRNFPREGFTKMFLVHYLPNRMFRAVYLMWKKTALELYPLGYHKILRLLRDAAFEYREYTAEILKYPAKYYSEYALSRYVPVPKCISPTLVFILRK